MNKILWLTCFIHFIGFTQVQVKPLTEELPGDSILAPNLQTHSSILPALENYTLAPKSVTGSIRKFQTNNYFRVHAIADLGYASPSNQYRGGIGGLIESQLLNKLFFRLSGIQGVGKIDNSFFSPKSYLFSKGKDSSVKYTDLRGRISFSPNSIFNFQVGLDNNFIGEGNRSLLLSDYAVASPFAQIRTKFWRLEYAMLYQFFREEVNAKWKSKYAATHYLSMNATKWLNFGFFETVIFQPKDTTLNRGFDAEYLNPMIFYRPQEYALGSSDNVILGLNISAKYKQHTLYGQIVLDEFLLGEIKSRSKWWGNKYGGQLGLKGRIKTPVGKIFYRSELNFVRPYTYSHSQYTVNYGNQRYALAHPYGSSFAEILAEVKWEEKNWTLKFFANYFLRGHDFESGLSYGGDIYQSYNIRAKEYKNTIGQGKSNNGSKIIVTAAYKLDEATNLNVFVENHIRFNTWKMEPDYLIVVGLRSCLWNDYRNY